MGRTLQDRQGGQGQEGRQVLLLCHQGLGQGGTRQRRPPGVPQVSAIKYFAIPSKIFCCNIVEKPIFSDSWICET